MLGRILLNQGWEFKQATALNDAAASDYLPVSQFPTVQFMDLLHHKLIPDPYEDKNELKTLWVNDADWTYRTQNVPVVALGSDERAVLVFEGLDTVVDVYLNGVHILFSKNMHVAHCVDVTGLLRERPAPSTLELRFRSATPFARQELERIGYKGRGDGSDVHYGGPERLFLRKAQYSWGWDWGPTVQACGPWKSIYLETYVSRIKNVIVTQEVSPDLATASLAIRGSIEYPTVSQVLKAEIRDPSGTVVHRMIISPSCSDGSFAMDLKTKKPHLWYPYMYGDQPLYTISLTLGDHDSVERKIGFRRLQLLQHPLKEVEGTSFVFEVNNVRIFCGGSCWIPGDFLLPRMTPKRYEDWLMLAKAGNQTMIRVWGGGIVEDDSWYNICDREGILIWQDFLYACGNYPASSDFAENIRTEAEQQVMRVGYHASMALWAGNNEDYMLAKRWGWEYDPNDEDGPWDHTDFPARLIYERILPGIVSRLGGNVPYVRSSPYGGEFANDSRVGDSHIWDVWHGVMAPYQDYQKYMGRFVSEFGFESAPNIRTINKAITNPRERFSQSSTWDVHDKAPGNTRRYGMYMSENFRFIVHPMENYVYCTQFLQAEAMKYAYNLWRREFKGPGEENCAGALVWQLNDIWPGMSWAVADVDLNPKSAFYVIKRALASVVVGMERIVTKKHPSAVLNYPPEKKALEIWAVNSRVEELEVRLRLAAFDIETGKPIKLPGSEVEKTVKLLSNRSNEIGKLDIPDAETTVVVAYLEDPSTSKLLARWVSWPEPLKFLRFRSDIRVDTRMEDETVFVSSNAPVKGVVLAVDPKEGEDAKWDDNFLDVVPGEEIAVKVTGLHRRKLEVRWLCDWERNPIQNQRFVKSIC